MISQPLDVQPSLRSILDIVNFALSLDLNGRMHIHDCTGNKAELIFNHRKLQNVLVKDLDGWEALQSLLAGVSVDDDFGFHHDEHGYLGPLNVDYVGLQSYIEKNANEIHSQRQGVYAQYLLDAPPVLPRDLFPYDKYLIAYGALYGCRANLRVQQPALMPTPEAMTDVLRLMHKHALLMQEVKGFFAGDNKAHSRKSDVALMDVDGYLVGVVARGKSKYTGFAFAKRHPVVGHDHLLQNLERIWEFLE